MNEKLSGRNVERAIRLDVAVGHCRRIEREGWMPVVVEQYQATGGVRTVCQLADNFCGDGLRVAGGFAWASVAVECRKRSMAALAMTIFMMPSPSPVQETPPA